MPSSSEANEAALLPSKQSPLSVTPVPLPPFGPRDLLIRVHATTINPVDALIQLKGIIWERFPVTLGCDISGVVSAVGSEVNSPSSLPPGKKPFKVGDRVLACVERGGHAKFCAAEAVLVTHIPDGIGYAQAAVLPLGVTVAASSLFEKAPRGMGLELPVPKGRKGKGQGKTVVVWGASSSVGSCAVQLLRAAGYEVLATAGKKNQEYARGLGAEEVFDYTEDGVVGKIVEAMKGREFAGVYAAVMDEGITRSCVEIVDRVGGKGGRLIGTTAPSTMPFSAVELPEGVGLGWCNSTADVLEKSVIRDELGWEAMEGKSEIPGAVWDSWLAEALEDGSMRCKPDPHVVGKGLEMVQEGINVFLKGVSASKIVIEL